MGSSFGLEFFPQEIFYHALGGGLKHYQGTGGDALQRASVPPLYEGIEAFYDHT
jgi:hypothetical protein